MRKVFGSLIALLLLSGLLPVASVAAQSDARCFPETGFCISGPIRAYWEKNGSLPVFGYPTSPLQTETIEGTWTGPIQWFQRDRLEDHSAQGEGVLAGRLGALRLEQLGRPWAPVSPQPTAGPGCRIFEQTGYEVCGQFLRYWERNGGLERFGYPITPAASEIIEGKSYTVQHFERRRMELHPENAGTPYEVLLGLLGNEVRGHQAAGGECPVAVMRELLANYNEFSQKVTLGCPVLGQEYRYVQGASARFERGHMYWIPLAGGKSIIYVLTYGPNNTVSAKRYEDTAREGDPYNTDLEAPPGLFEPQGGFGKLWRENTDIREALGWALEIERQDWFSYQVYEKGSLLQVSSEGATWLFEPNNNARNARTRY
jgi:hypothetical protein